MKNLFATLVVVLTLAVSPFAVSAQSLTVCDGSATNTHIPVYPFYLDESMHTQFVYPASLLEGLEGNTITDIIFFANFSSASFSNTFTIRIGSTADTAYPSSGMVSNSSFFSTADATVIYSDALTVQSGEMLVTLPTPYLYQGGNLLVDVAWTAADASETASDAFFGVSTSYPAGIYYCSYEYGRCSFLPKAEFVYIEGSEAVCNAVSSLSVLGVGSDTARISWTGHGETQWAVNLNGDYYSDVEDSVITITDLTPSTSYTVDVYAICGPGDTSAAVTTSFNTSFELPLVEGFESYTNVNTMAQFSVLKSASNYSGSWPQLVSDNVHGGSKSLWMKYISSSQYCMIATAEPVPLPVDSIQIHFFTKVPHAGLAVGYITDPSNLNTFCQIDTVKTQTAWVERTFTTEGISTTASQIYIAFKMYGASAQAYLDDITIGPIAGCTAPNNITAGNISYTGATLSWSGNSMLYHIEYGLHGFTPGEGMVTTTSADSVNLTALLSGAVYDVYIYGDCGIETSDTSRFSFTTRAYPISDLPYGDAFSNAVSSGWSFANSGNAWMIGNACGNGDSSALYISSNGTDNVYNTANRSVSYAYRTFRLTDVVNPYTISFDWRAYAEPSHPHRDNLRVWLAPGEVSFTPQMLVSGDYYTVSAPAEAVPTPEGWYDLGGGELYGQANWQHAGYDVSLTLADTGLYTLVFCWMNNTNSGNQPPAAIDNLFVGVRNCPAPYGLTLSGNTDTSLTFFWHPSGSEVEWSVATPDTSYVTTDTVFTLNGLSIGQVVPVSVRARCSDFELSDPLTDTFEVVCPVISSFPYVESFENEILFGCWQTYTATGSSAAAWRRLVTAGSLNSARTGVAALQSDCLNGASTDALVASPLITVPSSATSLVLRYFIVAAGDVSYEVLASTTDNTSPEAFSELMRAESLSATGEYVERSVSLAPYAGQTISIAFHNVSNVSGNVNYILLDDLSTDTSSVPEVAVSVPAEVFTTIPVDVRALIYRGETSGLTYNWSSAMASRGLASLSGTDAQPSLAYSATGIDTITLVVTNGYGSATAAATLSVVALPVCESVLVDTIVSAVDSARVYFSSDDPCEIRLYDETVSSVIEADIIIGGTNYYAFGSLLPATEYVVTLRHICGVGDTSEFSSARFVTPADTTVPPCDGVENLDVEYVMPTSVGLVWDAPLSGSLYDVHVFNALADTIYVADLGYFNGEFAIEGLTPGVTYNASVRTVCDASLGSISQWSDTISFTTEICHPVATVNVDEVGSTYATISWRSGDDGNGNGSWIVNFGEAGFDQNQGSVDTVYQSNHTIYGLLSGTDYEVYVATICDDGLISTYVAAPAFTTAGSQGIYSPDDDSWSLFPNPATASVTISCPDPVGTPSIEIVDMNGRKLCSLSAASSTVVDLSTFAPGAYFVRVTDDSRSSVKKLIVR